MQLYGSQRAVEYKCCQSVRADDRRDREGFEPKRTDWRKQMHGDVEQCFGKMGDEVQTTRGHGYRWGVIGDFGFSAKRYHGSDPQMSLRSIVRRGQEQVCIRQYLQWIIVFSGRMMTLFGNEHHCAIRIEARLHIPDGYVHSSIGIVCLDIPYQWTRASSPSLSGRFYFQLAASIQYVIASCMPPS